MKANQLHGGFGERFLLETDERLLHGCFGA
jgi:hypothetical protein